MIDTRPLQQRLADARRKQKPMLCPGPRQFLSEAWMPIWRVLRSKDVAYSDISELPLETFQKLLVELKKFDFDPRNLLMFALNAEQVRVLMIELL